MVNILIIIDVEMVKLACSYTWAIVPSYYLYSFIDTNKNYLQSQGVIFIPIVIHLLTVIFHFACVMWLYYCGGVTILSVAWLLNLSNAICALSLYIFIVVKEPTK